jgi:hypothetical protein
VRRIGREAALDLEAASIRASVVEGVDQPADLVLLARARQPFAEARLTDLAGPGHDAVDRTEGSARQDDSVNPTPSRIPAAMPTNSRRTDPSTA